MWFSSSDAQWVIAEKLQHTFVCCSVSIMEKSWCWPSYFTWRFPDSLQPVETIGFLFIKTSVNSYSFLPEDIMTVALYLIWFWTGFSVLKSRYWYFCEIHNSVRFSCKMEKLIFIFIDQNFAHLIHFCDKSIFSHMPCWFVFMFIYSDWKKLIHIFVEAIILFLY